MTYQYGYVPYYKPLRPVGLAQAAAAKDPYGLAPNNRSGPLGIGSGQGFAAPAKSSLAYGAAPTIGGPSPGQRDNPTGESFPTQPSPPGASTPPVAQNTYDLNTDPALQQVRSLVGLNNQQAQGEALNERQNLLLAYGDPTVAAAQLGANDPLVQAAGQNPTSTVKQLGQQRDQNLTTLLNQLNPANLDYSGYRVTQEQQNQTNYQNALAQAAAGLNSNLDTVTGNLNSALSANAGQLAQAISDAQTRASQQAAAAGGGDPGATTTTTTTPDSTTGAGGSSTTVVAPHNVDPVTQAIIDAGRQRKTDQLTWNLQHLFGG
jgi:uncharacterized FlaG/YvyC family protein